MMGLSNRKSGDATHMFNYVMGFMTAVAIFSIFSLWVIFRIGFSPVFKNIGHIVFPWVDEQVIDIPQDTLEELTKLSLAISNANNPTRIPRHNTIAVHPDEELGYLLRPNIRASSAMLKSTKAYNLDPPVLHYGDGVQLSDRLKTYIKRESRLHFSWTSDSKGFRTTLPDIQSARQILIIGDSVPFGLSVDDQFTVASNLQKLIGDSYRVINASVGGYNGQQAFLMAKRMSAKSEFAGLVYVACQNDFMEADDWTKEAKNVFTRIKSISDRFNNNIIIMLHTYMEYNLRDIFLEDGWSHKRIEKTHLLRGALPEISAGLGYQYHDWTEIVSDFMIKEKTIFSRFALYVDHCHLSPLGNRLMAEKLFDTIHNKW